MKQIEAWIARDISGFLCIYFYERPFLKDGDWFPKVERTDAFAVLDIEDFPDVTFDNSPVKVTITKP